MHATYQQFESMGRYGRGRYQDAGMTQAILFATTVPAAGPEAPASVQGGSPITVILLPFPMSGDAAVTSAFSVRIDRPKEWVPAGPVQRVLALRAWIDSLPAVPRVPQAAFDRGALY